MNLGKYMKTLWFDIWDNIGRIIFLNIIVFFTHIPAVWFLFAIAGATPQKGVEFPPAMWLLPGIVIAIIQIPITAFVLGGFHAMAYEMADEGLPSLGNFLPAAKRFFKRSFRLTLTIFVIAAVVITDISFFANSAGAMGLLSLVFIYALVYFFIACAYAFPLMIHQEMKTLEIIKNSLLLGLFDIPATLIYAVFTAILLFLGSGMSPIGGVGILLDVVLVPGVIIVLGQIAFRRVLDKIKLKRGTTSVLLKDEDFRIPED